MNKQFNELQTQANILGIELYQSYDKYSIMFKKPQGTSELLFFDNLNQVKLFLTGFMYGQNDMRKTYVSK